MTSGLYLLYDLLARSQILFAPVIFDLGLSVRLEGLHGIHVQPNDPYRVRGPQIVAPPILVLKGLHRLHVGHRHKLVKAASDLFDLPSLPLCLFLYHPLVCFSPQARKVVVVSSSPLAPGELARPSAPRIGGFRRSGITDVLPVSCQQRPLATGEAQEALEGTVGLLGLIL